MVLKTYLQRLDDALTLLAKDQVAQEALGEHIYANFKEAKEIEFDMYRTTVHQWERDQYLKCINHKDTECLIKGTRFF